MRTSCSAKLLGFALLILAHLLHMLPCWAAADEYKVKAAFILQFLKFVEWKTPPASSDAAKLHLVIVGDKSFGQAFFPLQNKPVGPKKIQVTIIPHISQLPETCDAVFITEFDPETKDETNKMFQDRSLLIIADEEWYSLVYHIHFFLGKGKVRFSIHNSLAHSMGIRIDSRLLGLAAQVYE
jgi:hypothetical protein